MNQIQPKKLLLSKWTAAQPVRKEKHFLVVKVVEPELPDGKIEFIELEAVFSKNTYQISWQELQNSEKWRRGWV
jgi:tryptophan-rich hypothetical protein